MSNSSEIESKSNESAISIAFIGFIVIGTIFAASSGNMEEISSSSFASAKSAVELAISLIGIMALWLGLMRVLEAGGCMLFIARLLRPIMKRLFKEVPTEDPAMSAIIMNISANMLGLGNAATPFGIRAMCELNRLNPIPGTATNAMCLFLAINTSSVALLPLGAIGIRAAAQASAPAAIWAPSFISTLASTIVGVSIALFLGKIQKPPAAAEVKSAPADTLNSNTELPSYEHLLGNSSSVRKIACWSAFLFCIAMIFIHTSRAASPLDFLQTQVLAHWLMPLLMLAIVLYGFGAGVHVYEAVTEGAKQGFEVAVRIIPFLVTILVAIGIFRASGGLEFFTSFIAPITNLLGMPQEVIPMAIIRPLSGSGAFAVMSDLTQNAPDSYEAFLSAVIMGSTETTFYVLAVYFGAAGITRIRYALFAALAADFTGVLVACLVSPFFF